MNSIEKVLSSWQKLISAGDFEVVYKEFKLDVSNKKWTIEQEVRMASYGLIAVNMKAHEAFKSNLQDPQFVKQMFSLAELCCKLIEKTWKCNGANFLGSIYNICRYFLSQNNVNETLLISQYAMKYVDVQNIDELTEEEIRSIKALLFLHLRYINSINLTAHNTEITFNLWKFIFSSRGFGAADANVVTILESFQYFCLKMGPMEEHFESVLTLCSSVGEMQSENLADSSLCTMIGIYRSLIHFIGPNDIKKVLLMIKSIDDLGSSCSVSQRLVCEFCCDILRFSMCTADTSTSDLVSRCLSHLKSLSSLSRLLFSHSYYFATVILTQLRFYWINDNFVYTSCIQNTFKFLLTVTTKMLTIDTSEVSKSKTNTSDQFYTVYLASLVISITYRVQDLDSAVLKNIYHHVYKAMEICLMAYDEKCAINAKQKSQLHNFIGVGCVNVSRIYLKAELNAESKELSLMAAQKISALPSSQLSNSAFQTPVEKLISCLYNSFKNLNLYEEALRTACVWAVKLPELETKFMTFFASLKAKISASENKQFLDLSSWDILIERKQNTQSLWQNVDLKDLNIISILRSELQLYMTYHIRCVPLIEKILRIVKEQGDCATKTEFYVLAGLIFTQSNTCLENAVNLLPLIESSIHELEQKTKTKMPKEKHLLHWLLLGNLYHTKFRIKLLDARCANEKEVILTESIKAPKSSLELGMEQESTGGSDIIHKYLTYESQLELTDFLDSAIRHWGQAIGWIKKKEDLSLTENFRKTVNNLNISTLIQEAALLYRLYCHQIKESQAWKLLHTLALICDDGDTAVYAFSNLLLLPGNTDLDWENEAENKLANVAKHTEIRYRLETARKLLITGHGSEGAKILSTLCENDVEQNEILWAKYHFIVSQYELARFRESTYSPILIAFKAYCKLVSWIKKCSWRNFHEACEGQSLSLDVTLYIGNLYRGTYQIKEARCYLEEHVNLIKKLCLPLKICEFLTALCEVSVITCNVEDIYAKLSALKNVLKFNDHSTNASKDAPSLKLTAPVSPLFSLDSDVRFASNFSSSDVYSSPVLESGLKFKVPEFVHHPSKCPCAVCEDRLYQLISCETALLFATYFYRAGKSGQASHHFKVFTEILNVVRERWNTIDRTEDSTLLKLQIVAKIRQSDFWASCGDLERATTFNEQASSEYNDLTVPDCALRGELRDQYRALQQFKVDNASENVHPKKKQTRQKQPLPITFKTPATKTPRIKSSVAIFKDDEDEKLSTLIAKMQVTPFPKQSRRVLFDEDDVSFATPSKPPSSASSARIIKKRKDSVSWNVAMQTPSSLGTRTRSAAKNTKENVSVEPKTRLRSRNK